MNDASPWLLLIMIIIIINNLPKKTAQHFYQHTKTLKGNLLFSEPDIEFFCLFVHLSYL